MSTEFKVVFEGEVEPRLAARLNAAIQGAVLSVVASEFPNPEDPGEPHGPGAPHEDLLRRPIINGIWFDGALIPTLAARGAED